MFEDRPFALLAIRKRAEAYQRRWISSRALRMCTRRADYGGICIADADSGGFALDRCCPLRHRLGME